eukprot:14230991-Alexandrium_andersonii.AAC.1
MCIRDRRQPPRQRSPPQWACKCGMRIAPPAPGCPRAWRPDTARLAEGLRETPAARFRRWPVDVLARA